MPAKNTTDTGNKLLDKRLLQQRAAEVDAQMGFVHDTTATGETAQEMMVALGIKPEDRLLSTEIQRMRHEHEERE
jgi:hypothetical protein